MIATKATDYNSAMSTTDTPSKRKTRTPAQRAADYQAKANRARAQAAKASRAQETRALLTLGAAVVKGLREGTVYRDLNAGKGITLALFLGELVHNAEAITDEDARFVYRWWEEQGWPPT